MKKFLITFSCLIMFITLNLLIGCSTVNSTVPILSSDQQTVSSSNKNLPETSTEDDILWDKIVKPYLSTDLWIDRDIYDAGHYLMVPLHASFRLSKTEWEQQFSNNLKRFVDATNKNDPLISNVRLNRLHYLYLASQFVFLATESEKASLIPDGLTDILYEEIKTIWNDEPSWQWDRADFPSMKERVEWKLNTETTKYKFYRAIIDEEKFVFSIAADLKAYERVAGKKSKYSDMLDDILNTSYAVYKQRVVLQADGSWLFQPGILSDHKDYKYAGNNEKVAGMKPNIISDLAENSSHSHRIPLWLTSFSNAYEPNSSMSKYYLQLRSSLADRFYKNVIVLPTDNNPFYLTNNYMDGRNGIFRWGYITQGQNNGYGPYELSGTLLLGWWSFLDDDRISNEYKKMVQTFPLSNKAIGFYVGPDTNRERNELVQRSEGYNNGFIELIVRLAGKVRS